jgi:hypothetical protein
MQNWPYNIKQDYKEFLFLKPASYASDSESDANIAPTDFGVRIKEDRRVRIKTDCSRYLVLLIWLVTSTINMLTQDTLLT